MVEQTVPGTPDGDKGGSEEQKKPAEADVSTLLKRLDEANKRIETLEVANKEIAEGRKKAKEKADEEMKKAQAEADANKTLEQRLADMDKTWTQKWTEKENAEKAEKEKLQSELKQQKLINSIAQLQGLRPEAKPFDILTLIQSELKFNEAGELDSESLIAAIQSRPFLMADKEVKPKIPMTAGKPKEKEPGNLDEGVSSLDEYMKSKTQASNQLKIPGR